MRTTVHLPKLGEMASDVVIERWLVQPGDTVAEGQSVLIVETDKVTTDVPAPVAGTIRELLVATGDEVPTGTQLCVIEG